MEAIIAAPETTIEIKGEDLLVDLEKLTDEELARVGGGQGLFSLG